MHPPLPPPFVSLFFLLCSTGSFHDRVHVYIPHPIPVLPRCLSLQAGSASRARGPAATPGSGYAADRSAGPARTTKARARTRPAASSSAAAAASGVGTRHGAEQDAAAPAETEGWACGTCTLVNKAKAGKCNACGAARPRRPPRARSAPAVPAVPAANGSGGLSVSSTPAAAAAKKRPPAFTPSVHGEGPEEEAQGGDGGVSAAVNESPSVPWEG